MEDYGRVPDENFITVLYSLTVSIFAIGGMVGALLVSRLVTRYGRFVCVMVLSKTCSEREFLFKNGRVSAQERDSGESYGAGVYWGGSDGLQQGLQDACHGHHWTLHHGGALRWARLVPGGINLSH